MGKYAHKFDKPWQCQCTYIPRDYADLIPDEKKRHMTPEEIQSQYTSSTNTIILDVRPDYEFKTGHLPGAKNFEIDLGDRLELKPQKAEAFKNVLGSDKSREIVIYCRSFR